MNYLLKQLKVTKNAYYFYIDNISKNTKKQKNKQEIFDRITKIYSQNNGTVGYRMMTDELKNIGIKLSPNTVYRYMDILGLKSITRRKSTAKYGHAHKVFENLINGNFTALKPNKKWCIDFTYLKTTEGKTYYNCSVLDLFDRSIVSSITSDKCNTKLAIDTVKRALNKEKPDKNIILHSDQGSQFTSSEFIIFCVQENITQSMSRAGSPTDNAPMERFFNTLKNDFYYLFYFNNFQTLSKCINNYIFVRYNYTRPHTYNGGLPPLKKRYLKKSA